MSHRPLIRAVFRQACRTTLTRAAHALGDEELRRSTMVFAPHPDDETLGCGGTILLKQRLGVAVHVVVMTDGSGSHPKLLPPEQMRAMRAREVREATDLLGVDPARVHLLDFPDGHLLEHREAAVARVVALLEAHRPEQLFVSYAAGENQDHGASCVIVHEAVRRVARPVTVFEYAIWSWRYWPHVGREGSLLNPGVWVRNAASTARGLLRSSRFRTRVDIQPVVAQKRVALERHASQLERHEGNPQWSTLRDVDGGEFIEGFFEGFELYRRIDFSPEARS